MGLDVVRVVHSGQATVVLVEGAGGGVAAGVNWDFGFGLLRRSEGPLRSHQGSRPVPMCRHQWCSLSSVRGIPFELGPMCV